MDLSTCQSVINQYFFCKKFCSDLENESTKGLWFRKMNEGIAKGLRYMHLRHQHHNCRNSENRKFSIIDRNSLEGPICALSRVPPGRLWLYGLHTVKAVLNNPQRRIHRLFATKNVMTRLAIEKSILSYSLELVKPINLTKKLGIGAVHQGILVETEPLTSVYVTDLRNSTLILVLDQITDPHNVGAIMRSAVAFGADALITTNRHSPQESAVLAKAASGALEMIHHVSVGNLACAIEDLNKAGFQTIGLDSQGGEKLEKAFSSKRIALVLGAEGKGLRQKTRQTVSKQACLNIPGAIKSLNVSNASAIALYAVHLWFHRNK